MATPFLYIWLPIYRQSDDKTKTLPGVVSCAPGLNVASLQDIIITLFLMPRVLM
jgi:hypothetical protein